jgi:hypothetical protein
MQQLAMTLFTHRLLPVGTQTIISPLLIDREVQMASYLQLIHREPQTASFRNTQAASHLHIHRRDRAGLL